MAGEAFVGGEAKFYYNSATYGSPTWVLIDNVQDLDIADSRTAAPAPTRALWPFIGHLIGLRDMTLSWSAIQKQETTDTVLTAMLAAYAAGTVTEFAIADQLIATTGCKYFRVTSIVTKADQSEPLDGVVTISFEAKPSVNNAGNNPSRTTI